jgi:Pyruvate/2-oxoacid:ferredoxin oxidoreductase delta subunit
MATRKIVRIDEERCNGCGLCIPNCAEGALQIVDGKAKLISDKFCDGLGACLGHCPQDAIIISEREAEEFDERAVELHLHEEKGPERKAKVEARTVTHPSMLHGGCPSSRPMQFKTADPGKEEDTVRPSVSMLTHWPVQLKLVPVDAPYFKDADLLVAADCVPVACPDFHRRFLKGRTVVVGCPKLDDLRYYREKLAEIFKNNSIKTVTVLYMEVPCCLGLVKATEEAMKASGKNIPISRVRIGTQGEIQPEGQSSLFQQPHTFAHPH